MENNPNPEKPVTEDTQQPAENEKMPDSRDDWSSLVEAQPETDPSPSWGKLSFHCSKCGQDYTSEGMRILLTCPKCEKKLKLLTPERELYHAGAYLKFQVTEEDLPKHIEARAGSRLLKPFKLTDKMQVQKQYVPFWLFDVEAKGSFKCDVHTLNFEQKPPMERRLTVEGFLNYDDKYMIRNIVVDANNAMEDVLMDELEPFDYSKLEPLDERVQLDAPIAKADTPLSDCISRAESLSTIAMAREATEDIGQIREVIVHSDNNALTFKSMDAMLILLPVYRVTCKAEGREYTFAVNGQTGEVTGQIPSTKYKHIAFCAVAGLAVLIAAVLFFSFTATSARIGLLIGVLLFGAHCVRAVILRAKGKQMRRADIYAVHLYEDEKKNLTTVKRLIAEKRLSRNFSASADDVEEEEGAGGKPGTRKLVNALIMIAYILCVLSVFAILPAAVFMAAAIASESGAWIWPAVAAVGFIALGTEARKALERTPRVRAFLRRIEGGSLVMLIFRFLVEIALRVTLEIIFSVLTGGGGHSSGGSHHSSSRSSSSRSGHSGGGGRSSGGGAGRR